MYGTMGRHVRAAGPVVAHAIIYCAPLPGLSTLLRTDVRMWRCAPGRFQISTLLRRRQWAHYLRNASHTGARAIVGDITRSLFRS